MFSENDINELIWAIVLRQSELNVDIISKIIAEMTHIASLDSSLINSYTLNFNALNDTVSRTTESVLTEISHLLYSVGKNAYLDTRDLYDYRNEEFLKFEDNEKIHESVISQIHKNRVQYSSAMNRTGLMVRDKGIWVPKKLKDAYVNLTNEAKQSVILKTEFNADRHITNLCDNELRILQTQSGLITSYTATSYLDSQLTNAVRDTQVDVLDEVGLQVQSVGVEISAHIMPAPDHAPVQGHQFTKEEFDKLQSGIDFVDVNGNKYSGFPRQIGAWNCRHITYPIIVGVSKPRKSERTLKKILSDNDKGYTMRNGRHFTLYECTQYQRKLERTIRKYKSMYEVASHIKNKELMAKYSGMIKQKTAEYKLFSQRANVPLRMERLEI